MSTETLSLFIAGSEWIWILVAGGILIFGAKKIPQMARSLGRAGKEFEKGKMEGAQEVNDMIGSDETLKLQKSAELLGVDTEGMNKESIKEAISKAMSKKEI
jgi:sec-independent protein translocase protein TatA